MFHLNKIKTRDGSAIDRFLYSFVCRGVAETCVYIHRSFQIWLWRSYYSYWTKRKKKKRLPVFPMDLSTDPSKTHTSQTHLQYSIQRKHLRTKPNLTTNLNLFITKRFFFSFALIALKSKISISTANLG